MDTNGERTVKFIKAKQKQQDKGERFMPVDIKENKTKRVNLDTEFGWCVFKGMFILLVFTNLLWACIHFCYVYKSFNATSASTEMWQDGTNNNQSITNG